LGFVVVGFLVVGVVGLVVWGVLGGVVLSLRNGAKQKKGNGLGQPEGVRGRGKRGRTKKKTGAFRGNAGQGGKRRDNEEERAFTVLPKLSAKKTMYPPR